MTRVGIVTINDDQNYGNRLQNYALQEFLKDQGFTPTTVLNRTEEPKSIAGSMPSVRSFIGSKAHAKQLSRAVGRHLRGAGMRRFDRRYLQVTDVRMERDADPPAGLAESFDLFVVGSDQVWNPRWRGTDVDFLTFAPPEKRVSYAASFGVSALSPEVERRYAEHLSGMRAISVRETEGAELVRRMTGRDVPVHVDPTLLLGQDRWRHLTGAWRPRSRRRSVVTYFLGTESPGRAVLVQRAARHLEAQVVSFLDRRQPHHYVRGPARFVSEIDTAALVITDSFHAAAFSILFGTPFIVVPREGVDATGSRIKTLLRTFQVDETMEGVIPGLPGVLQADSAATPQILEIERGRAGDYFRTFAN